MKQLTRNGEIIKASIYGIAGNMLLVVFKMLVGFMSNSIAIILDGVNNATDALSSILTIIGTKLAAKKADKEHPFGHGRIEYLTGVAIAVIILAAGLMSMQESIEKVISPGKPSYSALTITIIVVAILAKIALGLMFRHFGKKTHSEALIASGVDSNNDAIVSAGTLVVAIVQDVWGVNIDGWVGILISLVVCKAGIDVLRHALAPIIGMPENKQLVKSIKDYILTFPHVHDVNDVVLDSFGATKTIGSVHIRVPDTLTAAQISELSRSIAKGMLEKFNITLTVGVYTENTTKKFAPMKEALQAIVEKDPNVESVHGFYVNEKESKCFFDLVVAAGADNASVIKEVVNKMKAEYPSFTYDVMVDINYTE